MGSPASIWGKYDIRAVVGDNFGPVQFQDVGRTYAQFLYKTLGQPQEPYWVAVGHDARVHSPILVQALIEGLTQEGINVASLGLSTSPIVYFSEHLHSITQAFPTVVGTITVTASHNPSEYNGMKFTYQRRALEDSEFLTLQEIYKNLPEYEARKSSESLGEVQEFDALPDYEGWFVQHFGQIGNGIKVVVDSGNATAGIAAPAVLRRLGCEVIDIFTEPDGNFPNHHPDPCVHKNLADLITKVQDTSADFGVAFDGDADRLGIVDNTGRIMPGDQITMFLSEDVLSKQPGSTIVFDIKGTQTLFDYIQGMGGQPLLSPSGHAYMKRVMKEKNIPLGGELSGHIFFRDRHWGFDDALYAACRFLESCAHRREKVPEFNLSDFIEALPQTRISEEIRVICSREEGQQLIVDLKATLETQPDYFGSPVTEVLTIDGLRANMENGFFLVRASNTEPCITLRFEAPDENTYCQIELRIEELCRAFKKVSSKLPLRN